MKSDERCNQSGALKTQAAATLGLWLVALILVAMIVSRVGPLILTQFGG